MAAGFTNRRKMELLAQFKDQVPVGRVVTLFVQGSLRSGKVTGLAPKRTHNRGEPWVRVFIEDIPFPFQEQFLKLSDIEQ